ncbi:hypothetical protein CUR178_01693 [Leishmania enriettii]|uniref:Uncharacterized protein n=1 Tax=Leishmania enriettii TaxID=5663 RepID=A0A836GJI9_LEIEN|nr:hypothetical protein CUR178_01693 [Leishmania enriettii]
MQKGWWCSGCVKALKSALGADSYVRCRRTVPVLTLWGVGHARGVKAIAGTSDEACPPPPRHSRGERLTGA